MTASLAGRLELLKRQTDAAARIAADPIAFPRRFADPLDAEIAGWLASALAYGRVPLFQAALERILAAMGNQPRRYVEEFDAARDIAAFSRLYYRLNSGADIACFIYIIQQIVRKHGSIGRCFASHFRPEHQDVGPALEGFVREINAVDVSPVYGKNVRTSGLAQFFTLPSKGSACKRLNLYLRWMIRPADGVDLNVWTGIPASKLVVPVDTHVLRISRYLGLTRRRTSSWATALALTRVFKRIDPSDPLKFDFYICHHGISGGCPLEPSAEKCRACPLSGRCSRGRMLLKS